MPPGEPVGPAGHGVPSPETMRGRPVRDNSAGSGRMARHVGLPRLCRDVLEEASGITIPSSSFVLKVILAYLIAAGPAELADLPLRARPPRVGWVVVPVLSLGFAIGVERAAAYDMGYDSACDEIDVVEAYGGYPRAHVSRFASLYSTGRGRFTISYPNDPTALALPLDNGRSLRGEDVTTSVWQSYPVPPSRASRSSRGACDVPRRADGRPRRRDRAGRRDGGRQRGRQRQRPGAARRRPGRRQRPGEDRREIVLGTIAPGATVEVKASGARGDGRRAEGSTGLDPQPFLEDSGRTLEDRPENQGEIRLVAWVAAARARAR